MSLHSNHKLLLILCAGSAFAQTTLGQTTAWHIDPLHSSAQFSVRHMMISTVRGHFGGVKGAVTLDEKNPAADSDLKGPEFFDVKKYPVMKFKSKRVELAGPDKLKVTGDLTINAITRTVVLEIEGPTPPVKDTQDRIKVGVQATTKVSRKDFGILYNPVMETGGVAVSDEVAIELDIELIQN